MKASFRIDNKYEVLCQWTMFGLEQYSVDGKVVLRIRSLALRGHRKFKVGEGKDEHEVDIEIDVVPRAKSWIFPGDWIAKAYVDGVLVVDDLTPSTRSKVKLIDKVLKYALIIAVGFIAFCWLYIAIRYAIPH